jgi:four helix bundle protein
MGRDRQPRDTDFEDLEIYILAREIRKKFYALARGLPGEEKYLLRPQILDAARSLTNNIAEGRGRYYFQSQVRFIRDAIGSLNELIDDANICLDECYFEKAEIDQLKSACYVLRMKLKSYVNYLIRMQSDKVGIQAATRNAAEEQH